MFLDYYGCSKLSVLVAASFVEGVAKGCKESGCALVGGETAEMPDLYSGDDYDAAGAAIGVMQASQRLPARTPWPKAMFSSDLPPRVSTQTDSRSSARSSRRPASRTPILPRGTSRAPPSARALLTPTRIYVKPLLDALQADTHLAIKGMAHITGGGLTENVPRMLPGHLAADIDVATWDRPAVFKWLSQSVTKPEEMARTFNNGVGMIIAVSESGAAGVVASLEAAGEKVYTIGRLVKRETDGCVLRNLDAWLSSA